MLFFSIYDKKITKLSRNNRFRIVALLQTRAVAWSSWIDARRLYILLVIIIIIIIIT